MESIFDKVFSDMGLAGIVILTLAGVVVFLFRALVKEKDARRSDAIEMLGEYRTMATETNKSLASLESTLDRWLDHSRSA